MSIVYKCKKCPKEYSSYKSLWRHDALKHKINNTEITPLTPDLPPVQHQNTPKNKCSFCNIIFSRKDALTRHTNKNRCKKENNNESKPENNNESKLEKIEKENIEIKKEMEVLKNQLQKALKIHPKTLQKINNQLNNSGTINNVTIIQLGSENLINALNDKEKRFILDRQAMSLNHLVDLVHVSKKYKKFHNVYITNLQSTFAYKFDVKQNKFIAVNKNELLTDIVDSRMYDIQKFYDEIYPELEPRKAAQIKKFIDRMGNEEDELKDIKKEEIKLILYNNREKILLKEEDVILIKDNKNIDIN